jgi:hypothetical protein
VPLSSPQELPKRDESPPPWGDKSASPAPPPRRQPEQGKREEPAEKPRLKIEYDGDRQFFHPSQTSPQCDAAKRPRATIQKIGQRPSSGSDWQSSRSALSVPLRHSAEVSPDPSKVEKIFNNIDHEFVSEAPFLIEDRLKDLFAQFLEDLSGAMDTFPGTLLKSCVAKLSSTFSSSMQDVICSDIIPTLFNKIMLHVSEFCPPPPPKVDDVNISLNNKLDGLQDVIIGMSSVQSDKIESLSRDFAHMESQLRD